MFSTVLVGVGGPDGRKDALALATELGGRRAQDLPRDTVGPENLFEPDLTGSDWRSRVDRLTQRRQSRLDALPGIDGHVVCGPMVERLLELSAEVDLLVVATRAQGPISRLVIGNIGERLAAVARCPLLVLPAGLRPSAPEPDARSQGRRAAAAHDR